MSDELNEFLEFADFYEKRDWLSKDEKKLIEQTRYDMIDKNKLNTLLESNIPKDITINKFYEEVLWQPDTIFEERLKQWGLNKQVCDL